MNSAGAAEIDCDPEIADRIGVPALAAVFDQDDAAVRSVDRPPGSSDKAWSADLEERLLAEPTNAAWLIELGWQSARKGDVPASDDYYDRATRLAPDSLVERRLSWSRGQSALINGRYACALGYWQKATDGGDLRRFSWIPSAYAYALWGLNRKEQAVAWYAQAVRGDSRLGSADHANTVGARTPLNRLSRELFTKWAEEHAPFRGTVVLDVDIGPDGRLSRVQIEPSDYHPELLERIQLAALTWRFDPVLRNGRAGTLSTHLYVDVSARPGPDGTQVAEIQLRGASVVRHAVSVGYPRRSLETGEEGTVELQVAVGAAGRVIRSDVSASSGSARLDRAAQRAVKGYSYEIDRFNGKAEPTTLIETFVFQLSESSLISPTPRALAGFVRGRNILDPIVL